MNHIVTNAIKLNRKQSATIWDHRAWIQSHMALCLELGNMPAWEILGQELLGVVMAQLGTPRCQEEAIQSKLPN
jgi:hypothetical protein